MKPVIRVTPPGPKAKAIVRRNDKVQSNSINHVYPLVIKKAAGVNFEDVDGNRYLDFNSGIAVMNFGHENPKIANAIYKQSKIETHGAFLDFYEELPVRFSEELVKLFPGSMKLNRVFLSNSGTESVEAAIKLSRYCTKKKWLASFSGAFHGRTMGSLSLTYAKKVHREGFDPFLPVVHLPYSNPYRCPVGAKDNCADACIEEINDILRKNGLSNEIAALFIEPIQGEGGYVVPEEGFIKEIRKICSENEILLVDDEVQSGCYRTGKFLAIEHFNVKPDIVCLSKALGGGLPLGATVFNEKLNTWPPGSHASTFGGNLTACAAGLEVIKLMEDKKLGPNVIKKGNYIMKFLKDLQEESRAIGDVRGIGLMIGIEIVKDKITKEPDGKLRDKIVYKAFERGLSLLGAGESAIRIAPPLIIAKSDIDYGLEILSNVIKDVG
ncbi:MAG: acetyl ornithine aminotransferase family protein [Candidatus Aenigmarchaeota archaeon]|nr:acetyl ornithine aminotransferase family protein [Candidatus Aenigmarchaeota archaeon]